MIKKIILRTVLIIIAPLIIISCRLNRFEWVDCYRVIKEAWDEPVQLEEVFK